MDELHQLRTWEGYVDWRNKPALTGLHGGMLAASFVLVVEVLENLAYLANASNLVLYLSKSMHFSPSASANTVTNFMGTAFLLALLGGFLADSFFTTYRIYLISAAIEFMVRAPSRQRPKVGRTQHYGVSRYILHTMTRPGWGSHVANSPSSSAVSETRSCTLADTNTACQEVDGGKAVMLFAGLYIVALGVGGIKGSLPPHGAEQFDETTQQGRKQRSAFFNYFVFCLSCGALIAVTFVVWIEDNKGWQWGFGISTATILLSIPIFLLGSPFYRNKVPTGSPITTIFKVLTSATYNTCKSKISSSSIIGVESSPSCSEAKEEENSNIEKKLQRQIPTDRLKFLNRALINSPALPLLQCTQKEVEEVKIVLKIFPIFMSTIMLNCCLAQLSTFSVQQASTMNTKLGTLKIPPASLPVFPVIFIMILAPLYNHVITPLARKATKTEMGITHLQRIGTGLALCIIAMAVAALVEIKRKKVAVDSGLLDSTEPLPITFLWVALQYLFLGSADLFTLAGMMEFFFTEAPLSMRSLATSLSWASLAMGYYFSSVLVSIVNGVSSTYRHTPWLSGRSLNHYHLERFYWLMCILSGLNFLLYLFWTKRYKYRSTGPP